MFVCFPTDRFADSLIACIDLYVNIHLPNFSKILVIVVITTAVLSECLFQSEWSLTLGESISDLQVVQGLDEQLVFALGKPNSTVSHICQMCRNRYLFRFTCDQVELELLCTKC